MSITPAQFAEKVEDLVTAKGRLVEGLSEQVIQTTALAAAVTAKNQVDELVKVDRTVLAEKVATLKAAVDELAAVGEDSQGGESGQSLGASMPRMHRVGPPTAQSTAITRVDNAQGLPPGPHFAGPLSGPFSSSRWAVLNQAKDFITSLSLNREQRLAVLMMVTADVVEGKGLATIVSDVRKFLQKPM